MIDFLYSLNKGQGGGEPVSSGAPRGRRTEAGRRCFDLSWTSSPSSSPSSPSALYNYPPPHHHHHQVPRLLSHEQVDQLHATWTRGSAKVGSSSKDKKLSKLSMSWEREKEFSTLSTFSEQHLTLISTQVNFFDSQSVSQAWRTWRSAMCTIHTNSWKYIQYTYIHTISYSFTIYTNLTFAKPLHERCAMKVIIFCFRRNTKLLN